MSSVTPSPENPSDGSAQSSAATPEANEQQLSEYINLMSPYVQSYSGKLYTRTFEDWEKGILQLMDIYEIPEQYRVKIAERQLRDQALIFWNIKKEELGNNLSWTAFVNAISQRFRTTSVITRWSDRARWFRQWPRETFIEYGRRFDEQIVETCPLDPPMSGRHKMRLYYKGIRRCHRLPRPVTSYSSFAELRTTYESRDDSPDGASSGLN